MKNNNILLWIHLFLAVLDLLGTFSSCSEWGAVLHCRVWASHCGGFSSCRAQVLDRGLSSCDAWAWPLRGRWDPLGPGIEYVPCIDR